MSNFKLDLQAEKISSLGIDRMGLEDVKKRIDIHRKDGNYSINLNIKAFINLPPNQRGAHMSRSAESIDECITEHLFSPKGSIEEFGVEVARALLDKHQYANVSFVELDGPFIIEMRPREGKASSQSAYYLKCVVEGYRGRVSKARRGHGGEGEAGGVDLRPKGSDEENEAGPSWCRRALGQGRG